MNLLFLKKKANKYQLLLLALLISNLSFANDSIPKVSFLKHCKKWCGNFKESPIAFDLFNSWLKHHDYESLKTEIDHWLAIFGETAKGERIKSMIDKE